MVKKILGCIPILFILFCSSVWGASEPLRMAKLEVQVMPEFVRPADWPKDKPCLLTGIYGTIVNEGSKPYSGSITLQIPKAAGTAVHLVGEFKDGQGPESKVKYELNAEQGSIVWKPNQPIEAGKPYFFVVEYYSNPFAMKEKERTFDFPFQSKYDIDDVQFYFYKPIESVGFQLSKPQQQKFTNEFGQEVYLIQGGAFKSGSEHRISVQYMKDGFETVLEKHSKTAAQNQATPASATEANVENKAVSTESDASKDAWIIGGSIVIFGILVFAGLRSYRAPIRQGVEKTNPRQQREQIRALRRKLLAEELTEDEYVIERKKLV